MILLLALPTALAIKHVFPFSHGFWCSWRVFHSKLISEKETALYRYEPDIFLERLRKPTELSSLYSVSEPIFDSSDIPTRMTEWQRSSRTVKCERRYRDDPRMPSALPLDCCIKTADIWRPLIIYWLETICIIRGRQGKHGTQHWYKNRHLSKCVFKGKQRVWKENNMFWKENNVFWKENKVFWKENNWFWKERIVLKGK